MKYRCIVLFFALTIVCNVYGQAKINFPQATLQEEVVFAASRDSVINAGLLFHPEIRSAKPVVVIWVHGWGVNFYSPSYILIGRAFAAKGFTCISVNTRMHDLGNVKGYKNNSRVRGGGYWGVASEQSNDIAAWIDFAESKGFKDFFGIRSADAGVARISCPILAFYGTNGDVGNEKTLSLLESSIKNLPKGPVSVTTAMIKGAEHMYMGKESQIVDVISKWADDVITLNK